MKKSEIKKEIENFNKNNQLEKICTVCKESQNISNFTDANGKIFRTCINCRTLDSNKTSNKKYIKDFNENHIFEIICCDCKLLKINQINTDIFYDTHNNIIKLCDDCLKVRKENNIMLSDNKYLTKICSQCNLEKSFDLFMKDRNICLDCRKIYKHNNYILTKKDHNDKLNVYNKNRRKTDPAYKLRYSMSIDIVHALKKNNGSKKSCSCLKYLPYTIEELKQHIESLFEPWMNWTNQGKYNPKTWDDNDSSTWTWHLDHIIPQSKLLYSSMEDENFRLCWDLSNLRPYSAKQNILDGNRR